MKITLTRPTNAPNFCFELVAEDGQTKLIQTDWDYPGVASTFGWDINKEQKRGKKCVHNSDGTVACSLCGVPATDFISSAFNYLIWHEGESVDDPGYFEETPATVAVE